MSRIVWNPENVKRAVLGAVNAGLAGVGAEVEREARGVFGVGHGGVPSKPGMPPHSQTNRLRGSVGYSLGNDLSVRIGTDVKYGLYLEKGATVRPHGKALAIPLSPEAKRLTARGVKPRSIINAFSFDKSRPLRWIPTKNGGTLIVREFRGSAKKGKGARSEPLFLLTKRAVIQPRPWLRPAFAKARPRLLQRFVSSANRAFTGGLRAVAGGAA